ncbi:hypothetical protein Aspvir_009241 [Aspergillus viridinutans]|uniref:Protein kinase domain-containing protein n=1 Tax=Aspergillus viridinutans TaxID=75553 RepID=A0A9P3C795_ASPVI|nr:uncharacterized protein Aspvir_009241 [Aspergillus viridinutans]GIK05139.1 hypothetical protein Aspvir_009241 [Aspergillus viridinutans]
MDSSSSPDYKALFLREVALRRRVEEQRELERRRREQAEDRQRQAEEGQRQERERNQQTTFEEFIRSCHSLLSRPLRVEAPSRSTTGTIPPPTGKYCPTRLRFWADCPVRQQEIYNSVLRYLQSDVVAPRLFSPIVELEGLGRRFARRPISSEQDLESYERFAVEDHVHDIITELCKLPDAREEFQLGNGIQFDNHANALDAVEGESATGQPSTSRPSRPDQFCIHRTDGNTTTLLTTVEYKPPHKLSVENLRAGLRPMNFWDEVVQPETIPTDKKEKLKYNAERLAGSVLVQEYHVMIQEGLEYSYVTNGLALVLLRVPYDDPSTLDFYLCEPNMDVCADDDSTFQQPRTAIGRVLCICLMSFSSTPRSQEWRNAAQAKLHVWKTNFEYTRSQIPEEELRQTPPRSEYTSSEYTGSEYLPSSSPVRTSPGRGRRVPTRSQVNCAPPDTARRSELMDSSDSDSQAAPGRKRGFSEVTSSPPIQRLTRQNHTQNCQDYGSRQHANMFCTQRCLLGLQQGGLLDDRCPNLKFHQQGGHGNRHLINAERLVQLIKLQLDTNIDCNCTPMGRCGAYGAPFKVTCAAYGYTVVGKGTTSQLWKEVSREAEIYRVLRRAQGSAVPVFVGAIDLAKIYFLHGAGEIRHMLLLGWGGEITTALENGSALRREISKSVKEIRSLGVLHQDLRPDNVLWNAELERALIIDFHHSMLVRRPPAKQTRSLKRPPYGADMCEAKRLHVR